MNPIESIVIADKVAIIQEDACIGCTKCIRACPVDAILGAAKHMHTIIKKECTGCELCIESCPVNCITMSPTHPHPATLSSAEQRLNFRKFRLERDRTEKIKKQDTLETRRITIQAAHLRAQEKKLSKERDGK